MILDGVTAARPRSGHRDVELGDLSGGSGVFGRRMVVVGRVGEEFLHRLEQAEGRNGLRSRGMPAS